MTSLENTSTHSCINCSTSSPLHTIMIHGCRTTHCQERVRNLMASFYSELIPWTAGKILHQAEGTSLFTGPPDSCLLCNERETGSSVHQACQSSDSSRTCYWDYGCTSHICTCTVPIPRPTKFWDLFINFPVSHQAGYLHLQEEENPRSQQLAVLFLFPCCGQGITRQHPPVPGYHGNTGVLCSLFLSGSLFFWF